MTANDIKLDLTPGKGRPEWVFSSYAPTRNVPRQLFGGPQREQSMEEMRLHHYELAAAGNMNQAIQEAQALWQESVNQMDSALNDLNGAVKYIIDGENDHPNRNDITSGAQGSSAAQPSAFGQPAGPAAGAFGTANALLRDGESPRASGYLRPLVRDLQSDNRGLLSDNHQLSASLQASGSHLPWARVLPLANLQLLAADLPRLESQHLASRDSRKLEVLRLRSANLPLVSPPLQ